MNSLTLFLSCLLGVGVGAPFSKLVFLEQNASFQSPVDMYDWNVMYDLSTLYGDKNTDGVLSQEEYNHFIDSGYKELIPDDYNSARNEQGEKLVDNTFSFLGLLPVSNNQVYAYVFTKEQISSTHTEDGYFKYSAKDWEYGLSYFNNPVLVNGQYVNTIPNTSSMKFINEISLGKDGYFSKFIIEDNNIIKQSDEAKTSDGYYSMRIKPERFIVTYKNENKLDKKINTYELSFDSNYWNDENKMKNTLFNEKTIEIKDAAIDGFLCSNDAEQDGNGLNLGFGLFTAEQETTTNSAYEFYYYFFNIEGFDPDSIISITYSYIPVEWNFTYYNTEKTNEYGLGVYNIINQVMDSAKKGITDLTREQAKRGVEEIKNEPYYIKNKGKDNEEKFYLGYSESIGSRVTRTVNYDDNFTVNVNVPEVYKHSKHQRKVNIKSIINMNNIDSELGKVKELVNNNKDKEYDLNSQLRSFLKGEYDDDVDALYENVDHNRFDWAFLIHEDNWIRKAKYNVIDKYNKPLSILWKVLTAGIYTYHEETSKIVSTCHEPDSVLVTYMKVVKDDKIYNLNVISNPLSVRKNYIVGYHAPGLIEIIVKAVENFFTKFSWIIWVILAIIIIALIGILSFVFKPVGAFLKYVGKVLLGGIKLVLNTCYLLLIYWWLALIKKARQEELPPKWIFKKKN